MMIKRLGEIASFQRGLTYSKGDEAPLSSKCVLRSNNIDLESSSLDLSEIKYLRDDFIIPKDRKLKANSIFICMSNGSKQHVGKVAFIDKDMDYAFGGFMGLIVPSSEVSAKYVFYACQSSAYRSFLSQVGNGIGIMNLRFSDLEKFEIPVPSLSEQQRIVDELDLLSGIIEKKNAQLHLLNELAKSIFQEMFGDPIQNDKKWPLLRVIDIVKMQRGYDLPIQDRDVSGSIPVYGSNGVISMHSLSKVEQGVITGRSGTLGNVYCSKTPFWPLNTTLFSVDCHGNNIVYLKYLLLNFHLERYSAGAGVPTLNRNEFHSEMVIDVPVKIQEEFAMKVEALEEQSKLIHFSLDVAKDLLVSRLDKLYCDAL